MKKIVKSFLFTMLFLGLTIGVFPVMAQISPLTSSDCTKLGTKCTKSDTVKNLGENIWGIVNVSLVLVGLLAAIMIIYGGIKYIIARGDENAAEEAKKTILYAVIGLIVIGLSGAIIKFVIRK